MSVIWGTCPSRMGEGQQDSGDFSHTVLTVPWADIEKARILKPKKATALLCFAGLTILSFSHCFLSFPSIYPISPSFLSCVSASTFCINSVKSCFQNMEICKRRVNMYDTVNQSKTPFITHVAPSTSTNLTMTFNNQLTTVHNQVSGRHQGKVGRAVTVGIRTQVFPTRPGQLSQCYPLRSVS